MALNKPYYNGTVNLWYRDELIVSRVFKARYTLNQIMADWKRMYGKIFEHAQIDSIFIDF